MWMMVLEYDVNTKDRGYGGSAARPSAQNNSSPTLNAETLRCVGLSLLPMPCADHAAAAARAGGRRSADEQHAYAVSEWENRAP